MAIYKEIVTKAVIGKGKRIGNHKLELTTENIPDTVLGCWIINHNFNGAVSNGVAVINGSFDVNIWYSYDNDTKTAVANHKYTYQDKVNVKIKEDSILTNNSEIIVKSLKQPTVGDAKIENNKVLLSVDKELGIEVVGDTKVKVSIEESKDDYEIIPDIITEEDKTKAINEIDKEVKEDYLK